MDTVAITEKVGRSRIIRERLDKLPGGPSGRGMVCDVEMEEFAPFMSEDDEDEERRKVRVGTTKKSIATSSRTCVVREVIDRGRGQGQPCDLCLAVWGRRGIDRTGGEGVRVGTTACAPAPSAAKR